MNVERLDSRHRMVQSRPTSEGSLNKDDSNTQSGEGATMRGSMADTSNEKTLLMAGDKTESAASELSRTYKILKTAVLFWLYFAESAFIEVIGPILPELVVQTNSTYESVMRSISMRGVGFVIGSILAGLTVDRWFEHIDILMAAATLIYAAIGVATSYVTHIDILFVMFMLQGLLEQASRTGCIRIILRLWGKRSTAGLNAIHLGSSVAFIITPKLTGLFVDARFSEPDDFKNTTSRHSEGCQILVESRTLNDTNSSFAQYLTPKYPANFVNAFWMLAAIEALVVVTLTAYFIHKQMYGLQYETPGVEVIKQKEDMAKNAFLSSLSLKTCSPTKPVIALLIMMSTFLYYGVFIPAFRIFPKMIFSYARDEACFSVDMSTTLQSTYFIFIMAGRLLGFLLSSFVHPKYIMQASVLGLVSSTVALYTSADNHIVLWIGIASIGLSNANLLPGLFAVLNHYIEMTAVAMIVPMVGGAIGDVVVMYFLGPDYETNVGPKVLWTYMLILSVLQCLSILLLQILCHIHGDRYEDEKDQSED